MIQRLKKKEKKGKKKKKEEVKARKITNVWAIIEKAEGVWTL